MRTTEQILADMDAIQQTIPGTNVLTSKSGTSVFGMLRNFWALLVQSLERYVDQTQIDLAAFVDSAQIGSLGWYVAQVKAFQYGDSLTIVNGRPGYAIVDVAKLIIAQCAVVESDGRLLIKVAKVKPEALEYQAISATELASLKEYVRQVKYAGVIADVVTLPPDELKIVATVKYDRQIMNGQGQRLTNTVSLPALEAIILYIRSLPFNSVLNWTELTDFVQAYGGVQDFLIVRTFIRPGGSSDFAEFTRETSSLAGHMKLVDAQITYV